MVNTAQYTKTELIELGEKEVNCEKQKKVHQFSHGFPSQFSPEDHAGQSQERVAVSKIVAGSVVLAGVTLAMIPNCK